MNAYRTLPLGGLGTEFWTAQERVHSVPEQTRLTQHFTIMRKMNPKVKSPNEKKTKKVSFRENNPPPLLAFPKGKRRPPPPGDGALLGGLNTRLP